MSEEDLEVLITMDDPGEDALEEDTFDHSQVGNALHTGPVGRSHQADDPTGEQK